MTWTDLIAAVRAQIDVSDDQAYAWLLDRARVLNGESGWLTTEDVAESAEGMTAYFFQPDALQIEAVKIGGYPFRRSTPSQMDVAIASGSRRCIYAEIFAAPGSGDHREIQIWPPVQAGLEIRTRYLADVADNRTGSPPFPADIQSILADGAIAIGLARMDERFDSAGYFDAKFADGLQRLKRRANSHVGRGGTPIRLVT